MADAREAIDRGYKRWLQIARCNPLSDTIIAALEREGLVIVPAIPPWEAQIAGRDSILDDELDEFDFSTEDAFTVWQAMLRAHSGEADG